MFGATHQLLGSLIRGGEVQAVRIDHPDGLFGPAGYFRRLQDLAASAWNLPPATAAADAPPFKPIYVVAEKILSGTERLPDGWAVPGTTGYSYLYEFNGLLAISDYSRPPRPVVARLTCNPQPFHDVR